MATATETIVTIHNTEDWEKLLAENPSKPIVVDFHATWCGPCRLMKQPFEDLANANPDCIFVKCDVDEAEAVAASAGVSAMPTFVVYLGGKKVKELVGADKDKLAAMVKDAKRSP